ncbi:GNAT family N-acetyltransferase [Acinetobacter piscicola]|uniref:GNAT family N-acetyltransferase n=1 Tax=Acinetobacter piscicola TaxID=2006115 RepID=UPI001E506B4B|nr:GNAT family protein [Acinetobacter piscicola]
MNIVQESDAVDIYIGIKESLNDLRRFPASLPWALEAPNLEASQAFCCSRLIVLLNKENFVFVIRSKRSHAFLGIVDIHCIYWDENKASIGLWGNARYQRQGYMRQALLLFVNTLFTRGSFRELKAYVDVANSSTYIV